MRRRHFIAALGGASFACPLATVAASSRALPPASFQFSAAVPEVTVARADEVIE